MHHCNEMDYYGAVAAEARRQRVDDILSTVFALAAVGLLIYLAAQLMVIVIGTIQ